MAFKPWSINDLIIINRLCVTIQDNLKETEEKYRKAMVSIAQLDNEKQALLYQVDCLKDRYCVCKFVYYTIPSREPNTSLTVHWCCSVYCIVFLWSDNNFFLES